MGRFTKAQVIGVVKELEAGKRTAEVYRNNDFSQASFLGLEPKCGGMEMCNAAKLNAPEDEKPRSSAFWQIQ